MTLGLGLGLGPMRIKRAVNIKVLRLGDSIQARMLSQNSGAGQAAFESEALKYVSSVAQSNQATSGSFLTEAAAIANSQPTQFWIAGDLAAKGTQYTGKIDSLSDKASFTHILLDIGNNDAYFVPGTVSRADYKTALNAFLEHLKTDFPNAVIYLNIIGSHGGATTGHQDIRETALEVIGAKDKVYQGIDIYDLDRADNVHPSQSGNEEKGRREALLLTRNIAGPEISAAVTDGRIVTISLSHSFGSDLSMPSSGDSGFNVLSAGSAIGITSISKLDASSFSMILDDSIALDAANVLSVIYDRGAGLGLTSPDVLTDNASPVMPIRSGLYSLTSSDPVAGLDHVLMYFDIARSGLTLSGTDLQGLSPLMGNGNAPSAPSGQEPVYDVTNGLISFPDADSQLAYDGFSAASVHSILMKIRTPASSSGGSKTLCGFGQAASAIDTQARFTTTGTASLDLAYVQKEGGGASDVLAVLDLDTDYLLLFEFTGDDNCNLYINDLNTIAASFDPRDAGDFDTATAFIIGDAAYSTNQTGQMLYALLHTSDILSANEKAVMESYFS